MAKSVIGADRNHVMVADLDDLLALSRRVAALEAQRRSEETPKMPPVVEPREANQV